MKRIPLLILLLILCSCAFCEKSFCDPLYQVLILNKDDTTFIGYIKIYTKKTDGHEKEIKLGDDILPLIKQNYASEEQVKVYTNMITSFGSNLFEKSAIQYHKVSQMKKIVALQTSGFSGGASYIMSGSELDEVEYSILKNKIYSKIGGYQGLILFNTNPAITQLELYLYTRQIHTGELLNSETGAHPFLSHDMENNISSICWDIRDGKIEQLELIIDTLEKCRSCWSAIADSLKNCETILPKDRLYNIAVMKDVILSCDKKLEELKVIREKGTYVATLEKREQMAYELSHCIFPGIRIINKYNQQQWYDYLLQKGIVMKFIY